MAKTTVINLKTGVKYDQYIGRAGHGQDGYFGNPYPLRTNEPRGSTLEQYKIYFKKRLAIDSEFKQRIHSLKGKTLACFCKPEPCHGDIIAEYLNGLCDYCYRPVTECNSSADCERYITLNTKP